MNWDITTAHAPIIQSLLAGPAIGTIQLYASEWSAALHVERRPTGLMYEIVHQRVAQRAGKRVIWAHEDFKRVQNFVSTYNESNVKNERISADPKRAVMDSAGVERAVRAARYLENDAPTAKAHSKPIWGTPNGCAERKINLE
jgi:hypothetical protein